MIGARAVLGRPLQVADNDPAAPNVAVLSHGYWQRRFGGDLDVVGLTLPLDAGAYAQAFDMPDAPYEVVGVLAPEAALPGAGRGADAERPDIWLPVRLAPGAQGPHSWNLLAKLSPDVSLAEAQAELDGLTRGLIDDYPDQYSEALFEKYGFRTRAHDLKSFVVGPMIRNLWVVHGCVVLLLLVAVVNVANLFLVRAEVQRREMAVRTALGARRSAILRLFGAHTALVALAASVIGLAVGNAMVNWLTLASPWRIPRLEEVDFGGGAFAFTLALALVVCVGVATFCAWRINESGPGNGRAGGSGGRGVRGGGRESHRFRAAMTVGQVALSLVLVSAAVLMIESFRNLRGIDTGIQAEGAGTLTVFHAFGPGKTRSASASLLMAARLSTIV